MRAQHPGFRTERLVMMQLQCPFCGPRDEREFRWGGEAHLVRPEPPDVVSDTQWTEYLYFRQNQKGMQRERWFHAFGCRRWFNVSRCTLTHEILSVYGIGEKPNDSQVEQK